MIASPRKGQAVDMLASLRLKQKARSAGQHGRMPKSLPPVLLFLLLKSTLCYADTDLCLAVSHVVRANNVRRGEMTAPSSKNYLRTMISDDCLGLTTRIRSPVGVTWMALIPVTATRS